MPPTPFCTHPAPKSCTRVSPFERRGPVIEIQSYRHTEWSAAPFTKADISPDPCHQIGIYEYILNRKLVCGPILSSKRYPGNKVKDDYETQSYFPPLPFLLPTNMQTSIMKDYLVNFWYIFVFWNLKQNQFHVTNYHDLGTKTGTTQNATRGENLNSLKT